MNKLNYMKLVFRLSFLIILLSGCDSEYTKLVKRELKRNEVKDSILFDLHFGNTRSEFYRKCLQLNRQKLVNQGPSNSSVEYIFNDSIFHDEPTSIRLLFFPIFDSENTLIGMNYEFSYMGWAPWNEQMQASVLKPKVVELLNLWYGGNEFIELSLNEVNSFVKVDANRRIILYEKDPQSVVAKIHNLTHERFKHSISK